METDQNLKCIEPEGKRSDFCAFYVLGYFDTLLEGIVFLARPQNRYKIYRGGEGTVPFSPSDLGGSLVSF